MARVSTYLNFPRTTEEAFSFYTSVFGTDFSAGNNMYINLEPDTRGETDRFFTALGAGAAVEMPLQEMFWGGCYGIHWMFNCANKA